MRPRTMWVLGLASTVIVSGVVGCSGGDGDDDDSPATGGVSGQWCGRAVASAAECTGEEVVYLELTQSGSTVTGQA